MKKGVKYALRFCVTVLTFVCIAITYGIGTRHSHERLCTGLDVIVADSAAGGFVSGKDISSLIRKEYGKLTGIPVDSIDLTKIERIAGAGKAVSRSEAYTTSDGKLHLRITQRKPIVRFQNGDSGFYADKDGNLFPLQRSFSAEVPVVEGALPVKLSDVSKGRMSDPGQDRWIMQVIGMIDLFNSDRNWKDCITQIHVNSRHELEVATRRGNEVFIYGQPTEIREKMDKMETYFRMIRPSRDAAYRRVDLRFKGEILGKD